MADEGTVVRQNTGVLKPGDGIVNGETARPGEYGKTEGGVPSGTPPAGQSISGSPGGQAANPQGTDESVVGSTHPDGPGVGGD